MKSNNFQESNSKYQDNLLTICILGMHRSGTSCLSGCLQSAGLSSGDVIKYAVDNPKGNRENKQIMNLNRQILANNNGSWDNPPENINYLKKERKERDKIIQDLNDQFGIWMFKDPRTILTFSFWQEAISNFYFIGTFRHPLKVAISLYQRSKPDISFREGIKLWIYYNQLLLKQWKKSPFPLICFDLTKPEYLARLESIINKLNIQLPQDLKLSISQAEEFYEEGLVHQSATKAFAPNEEDLKLLEKAENLYNKLLEKSKLKDLVEKSYQEPKLISLETSIESYNKAIQVEPNNSKLYFVLGNLQRDKGIIDDAITSYKKALKIEPNNLDYMEQLVEVLLANSQSSEAFSWLMDTSLQIPQKSHNSNS